MSKVKIKVAEWQSRAVPRTSVEIQHQSRWRSYFGRERDWAFGCSEDFPVSLWEGLMFSVVKTMSLMVSLGVGSYFPLRAWAGVEKRM